MTAHDDKRDEVNCPRCGTLCLRTKIDEMTADYTPVSHAAPKVLVVDDGHVGIEAVRKLLESDTHAQRKELDQARKDGEHAAHEAFGNFGELLRASAPSTIPRKLEAPSPELIEHITHDERVVAVIDPEDYRQLYEAAHCMPSASPQITQEQLEALPHAAYGTLTGWTAHYVPVQSVLAVLETQPTDPWRPMLTAPLDGTEVELMLRHFDYFTALKVSGREAADGQYQGNVIGKWIDHNGGGWTWNGHAGSPIAWRPFNRADGGK